jgi:hypothetical protein
MYRGLRMPGGNMFIVRRTNVSKNTSSSTSATFTQMRTKAHSVAMKLMPVMTFTMCGMVTSGAQDRLWIFPEDNDVSVANLHIDDAATSACPLSQVYTNTSSLPLLTSVSNFIEANGYGGPVIVTNVQTVHFRAGKEIGLLPGFQVNAGGAFTAMIEPCGVIDRAESDEFGGGGGNANGCFQKSRTDMSGSK